MSFRACSDEIFAHWLHVFALTSNDSSLAKGYARRDARLRKSAAMPSAPTLTMELPFGSVEQLLEATPKDPPDHDGEWFQMRWALGEKEAMDKEGQAMVKAIGELPQIKLFSAEPFRLLCTPALAQSALAHHAPNTVICGPEASPLWVVNQAFAALLAPALPLDGLSKADQAWVAAHVTIGVWRLALAREEDLPVWAELLTPYFLPSLQRSEETAQRVLQIAEHVLDEPPGETSRIADGLARRMPSRLIRAWRRGYFVPPAFDLEGWVRTHGFAP
jgi:hypothetical protein